MTLMLGCLLAVALLAGQEDDPASKFEQWKNSAVYLKFDVIDAAGRRSECFGSGICVAAGGWIVTNRHVFPGKSRNHDALRIVTGSGTPAEASFGAELVLVHPDQDLALLRCESAGERLVPVRLAMDPDLKLTQPVYAMGFPGGHVISAGTVNPSVSVVAGKVSSIQSAPEGWRQWLDIAAPVAGGSSGSGILDESGQLVGVACQTYAGFTRTVPVEFVHELLGAAWLDVELKPAPDGNRVNRFAVRVTASGPALDARRVVVRMDGPTGKPVALKSDSPGTWSGLVRGEREACLLMVEAITADGAVIRRVVGTKNGLAKLQGTVHAIELAGHKEDGHDWDGGRDRPDPKFRVFVNDSLVAEVPAVSNQFRLLADTAFECEAGDRIRIEVHDEDLFRDDFAGQISFRAEPDLGITRGSTGSIERCEVTVREIPVRIAVEK